MSEKKDRIQLSDHFTIGRLLRFTIPSMVMMLFASIYSVVDGFFVSNYAGKSEFAAVNLIFPAIQIFAAVGMMLGTGGSALVAKTFGEGDKKRANGYFSMLIYVAVGLSTLFSIVGAIFIKQIAVLLGAEGALVDNCATYGRLIFIALPFFILQNAFQAFLITAERPQLGLAVTVIAGVTNMILDFLFVGIFRLGLVGAAAATDIAQIIGGLVPLIYFIFPNSSTLRLRRALWSSKALFKSASNGLSEFFSNISFSIVAMAYNAQLLKIAGEDGVAAYGVIQYFAFFFVGIFMGYCIGSGPIMGYHFGAQNHAEMKNVFKKSYFLMACLGVGIVTLAEVATGIFCKIFVSYDQALLEMTIHGMRIYCISFLMAGFTIYSSSLFTALNNGVVSAVISVSRSVVFELGAVLLLPALAPQSVRLDAIWSSVIVAEILSIILSVIFVTAYRKRYKYF